jgi:hypothetical protein
MPWARLGLESVAQTEEGFTLLETVFCVGLAGIILAGVASVAMTSQDLIAEEFSIQGLDERGRRVVSRVVEELRQAVASSVRPLIISDSSYIEFQKSAGFSGGAVQLAPLMRIAFVPADAELPDGLDNNGDGLADEGSVEVQEGTNPPVRISENVLGLRFNRAGNQFTIEVDVAVRREDGDVATRSLVRSVTTRN